MTEQLELDTLKRKVVKIRKFFQTPIFKLFLVFFSALVFLGLLYLEKNTLNKRTTVKTRASETKETIINGVLDSNYQEQPNNKNSVSEGIKISSLTKTQTGYVEPLPTTGQWKGKTVRVVPNDYFFTQYNYFTNYGIRSIKATKDGRIFLGGLKAFAIRPKDDENWTNVQLVEIPQSFDPNGSNVILKIVETNAEPGEIYLKGLDILLRLDEEGMLSVIKDPSTGKDLNIIDIVPFGISEIFGYGDGPVGYGEGALLYINKGNVRKWLLPRPDPTTNSDSITTIFIDKSNANFNKLFAIIYHCEAAPCFSAAAWNYYLYQFNFADGPEGPLQAIRLSKISQTGYTSYISDMYDGQVGNRTDDPSKKIFYSRRNYTSNILTPITNFDITLPELTINTEMIPTSFGCCGTTRNMIVENRPEGNVLWMTGGGEGSYTGIYYVIGLDINGTATFSEMTTQERQTLLADVGSQSITIDLARNIYVGHVYSPGSKGLVTIFQEDQPSPTPTFAPTPTPTPTPSTTLMPTNTPTPTNNPPFISTTTLPEGKVGRDYQAEIRGADADFADSLTMNVRFLPRGLSKKECKNVKRNGRNSISCKIEGRPKVATGTNYNITVLVSDGKATTSKRLKLRIKP